MNFKTEHMIPKLCITAILLCLLPASAAFGQQLKKEKLKGTNSANTGRDYAVFYSAGMPESAVWPLGMKLSKNYTNDNCATIRHTQDKGNGNNTSVNDKVPFRFIVAPADGTGNVSWAGAMGFNTTGPPNLNDNSNSNPNGTFPPNVKTGCNAYSTTEFPSGWRLPTQRELMLMWLFREGIGAIYSGAPTDKYWSATEYDATQAWFMDFSATAPKSHLIEKTSTYKYRCVRDY